MKTFKQMRKFGDRHLLTDTVELGFFDMMRLAFGREIVVLGHADRIAFRWRLGYEAFNLAAERRE